jgi:hypothetical protein
VSLVSGRLTTRLWLLGSVLLGSSELVVGIVVGAAGHEREAGPPNLVAHGGQGDLGVLAVEQAGSVAVTPTARLTADAGGEVKDRPPSPGRSLSADPKLWSPEPDWERAGSSPAARHTLDHSAQRPVWPTKATSPAAVTVDTPRIWVSLAPWVLASNGTISASSRAIWPWRASSAPSRAARVAGLPAVAARWAGSAAAARAISRPASGPDSRQPQAAKIWRSSAGPVAAMRPGSSPRRAARPPPGQPWCRTGWRAPG